MADLAGLVMVLTPAELRSFVAQLSDADADFVAAVMADQAGWGAAGRRAGTVAHLHDALAWTTANVDFGGGGLAPYQAEALEALDGAGRLAVRSLHGAGKTTIGALALLWFALTRDAAGLDWKVPTIASVYRQLDHYFWPEVHRWARRLRWDQLGRGPFGAGELLQCGLKMRHGEAWAMTSTDPAALEGAHAAQVLVVIDEAKAVPEGTWDAIEGAFAGGGATGQQAWALALSTPGTSAGRFYDICRRREGLGDWATRHVSLADAVAAGRVSGTWASSRAVLWGETSAVYRNRVLGEFADDDPSALVPLRWAEAAVARWDDVLPGPVTHVGVDVGRTGDMTSVVAVAGTWAAAPVRTRGDTAASVAAVVRVAGSGRSGPVVTVDAAGIGAGVYDALRAELGSRVRPYHGASATSWRDRTGELRFANARAAAWWHLRDVLDPDGGVELSLPPDDRLVGDVVAPRWRWRAGGRVLLEDKEELVRRLGRSPDDGDALVMALWGQLAPMAGGYGALARPLD